MDFQALKSNPLFWEGAFFVAVVLLLFAHKVSIEGMIE